MIRECQRCHTMYRFEKSRAELRLTYCSMLCQLADLGLSIDEILGATIARGAGARESLAARALNGRHLPEAEDASGSEA
jgi:hypothetical protein